MKYILDTDPGVDDAIALAFACKAGMDIAGICTVYGNSHLEDTTRNALMLLELVQRSIPVFPGAADPLQGEKRLAHSHGTGGFGGYFLETQLRAEGQSAESFLIEMLQKADDEPITIIAIGPVTNLAKVALSRPDLLKKAAKIILMGGVFGEKGNVSAYAEFNIYNDPFALHTVLSLGHENITIVPANVCRKVTFDESFFQSVTNSTLAEGFTKITKMYVDYYSKDAEYGGFNGGVMYDLLAVALEVEPDLFKSEAARVVVEYSDKERYGETKVVEGKLNCTVLTAVQAKELETLFLSVMNSQEEQE